MKKLVIATIQHEGIHQWADCPFEEVYYLRMPHRHMFHIKAWKVVTHNNRDVEIIMLKKSMADFMNGYGLHLGQMSCEDIAQSLIDSLDLYACEVLEDGENGAYLERI